MTQQTTVIIGAVLTPDPVTIELGDIVVWMNNTRSVQTASSADGGQSFTTGPIQPGANSLPITVSASISYSVLPASLSGSVVAGSAQLIRNESLRTGTMALSFATDVKPMFTAMDQDHMLNQVGLFDLWNYDDVKNNAQSILKAVSSGSMPPPDSGEQRWSTEQVNTFQEWVNAGFPP